MERRKMGNEQKNGVEGEMREEQRRENQERTTAWGRRNRGDIIMADDLKLWKIQKKKLENKS